jgi:hypothetical protein
MYSARPDFYTHTSKDIPSKWICRGTPVHMVDIPYAYAEQRGIVLEHMPHIYPREDVAENDSFETLQTGKDMFPLSFLKYNWGYWPIIDKKKNAQCGKNFDMSFIPAHETFLLENNIPNDKEDKKKEDINEQLYFLLFFDVQETTHDLGKTNFLPVPFFKKSFYTTKLYMDLCKGCSAGTPKTSPSQQKAIAAATALKDRYKNHIQHDNEYVDIDDLQIHMHPMLGVYHDVVSYNMRTKKFQVLTYSGFFGGHFIDEWAPEDVVHSMIREYVADAIEACDPNVEGIPKPMKKCISFMNFLARYGHGDVLEKTPVDRTTGLYCHYSVGIELIKFLVVACSLYERALQTTTSLLSKSTERGEFFLSNVLAPIAPYIDWNAFIPEDMDFTYTTYTRFLNDTNNTNDTNDSFRLNVCIDIHSDESQFLQYRQIPNFFALANHYFPGAVDELMTKDSKFNINDPRNLSLSLMPQLLPCQIGYDNVGYFWKSFLSLMNSKPFRDRMELFSFSKLFNVHNRKGLALMCASLRYGSHKKNDVSCYHVYVPQKRKKHFDFDFENISKEQCILYIGDTLKKYHQFVPEEVPRLDSFVLFVNESKKFPKHNQHDTLIHQSMSKLCSTIQHNIEEQAYQHHVLIEENMDLDMSIL